ncbi:MAG: ABC transporter ATP-binding protein [Rhodospirillaceae bacterium]|nr:ABC transporter ATP-binding protein [Rhodospirillaceae bacterium]
MIAIRNLSHAYYDRRSKRVVHALDGVNIDVRDGEFICLIGPSGCGKSTVLRILAGLEPVISGLVEVPTGRTSVVFQDSSLFPWLTVEKNIAYPLRVRRAGEEDRAAKVSRLLDMMKLQDFRKAYPHQLSGGMKQRVSVARALADDREVLLMDEPFGALDEQTRLDLQQELLRIWEQSRKTVVFVTHSVEEALVLADRIIVMSARPGRILREFRIPFERPRNVIELRRSHEFGSLAYDIWSLLRSDRKAA